MAVENLQGTLRGTQAAQGIGEAGNLKMKTITVEMTAAASATSTYFDTKFRIPSNARISGLSKLYFDDLATTGSPTLDIGLFAVNSNVTSDDDALNDGIDCATAAGSATVIKAIENYGKRAWEFVSGQTTDPKGELEVKVTLKDAACDSGGSLTLELYYSID